MRSLSIHPLGSAPEPDSGTHVRHHRVKLRPLVAIVLSTLISLPSVRARCLAAGGSSGAQAR